jgi:hypothetical protein
LLLGLALGCHAPLPPAPQPDDALLYRTVLLYWATCFRQDSIYVLEDTPDPVTGRCEQPARTPLTVYAFAGWRYYAQPEVAREGGQGVPPALWQSFIAANRDTVPFPALAPIQGIAVVMADSGTPRRGESVITFARPGLSADGDSALVELFENCGPTCGSGEAFLMVRTAAGWQVARPLWRTFS